MIQAFFAVAAVIIGTAVSSFQLSETTGRA
jgi:hypothetical protein